jgi:hypothetical protein
MLPGDYITIPAPKDTCNMTVPEMPCTRSVKASRLSYENVSIENLKYLAKIYRIRGYTKMSKSDIIKHIKEHELLTK